MRTCKLINVVGSMYLCEHRGCGRMLKIEFAKPTDKRFASLKCYGTDEVYLDPAVLAEARRLGESKVISDYEPPGPGTEFRRLARDRGIEEGGCACAETALRMNQLGPEGCRREIESLADEVLANSRGKVLYMSRDMARWLIEQACRVYEASVS